MAEKIVLVYNDDEEDELVWEVGGIYKFHHPKLNSEKQHRFILCVKRDDDRGDFVYCTSQEGTMNYLVKSIGYDERTLPYFTQDGKGTGNHFWKETFANCNEPLLDECLIELTWKFEDGELTREGTISYSDFDQIRTGMLESEYVMNVIPNNMKYPGEED